MELKLASSNCLRVSPSSLQVAVAPVEGLARGSYPVPGLCPLVRSTRSLSSKIVFHGCVTMGSHCSPGFSPLSLVIPTWLRTGLIAFLVVTFQQTSLCLLSRILLLFVAGQLHCHLQEWKSIAASPSSPLSRVVLDWLEDKVQFQGRTF